MRTPRALPLHRHEVLPTLDAHAGLHGGHVLGATGPWIPWIDDAVVAFSAGHLMVVCRRSPETAPMRCPPPRCAPVPGHECRRPLKPASRGDHPPDPIAHHPLPRAARMRGQPAPSQRRRGSDVSCNELRARSSHRQPSRSRTSNNEPRRTLTRRRRSVRSGAIRSRLLP